MQFFTTPFLAVLRANRKRLRVVIEREYPILFPLFFLVLGNVLASIPISILFCLVVATGICMVVLLFVRSSLLFAVWFLFGIIGVQTIRTEPTQSHLHTARHFSAEITDMPSPLGSGGWSAYAMVRPRIIQKEGEVPQKSMVARVLLRYRSLAWDNSYGLTKGDVVQLAGVFKPFSSNQLLGRAGAALRRGVLGSIKVEAMSSPHRRGVNAFFGMAKERLLIPILQSGSIEGQAVFSALLLGSQSYLTPEIFDLFRDTGLLHLLVVSGYHVSLLYIVAHWVAQRVLTVHRASGRLIPVPIIAHWIGLSVAVCYGMLVGLSVSVLRSLIMLVCVAESRRKRGRAGILHGLLLALFLMSVVWPGVCLEPGLHLGCAALLGIMVGKGVGHYGRLLVAVRVTLCVWAFTQMVSWMWFGSISVVALISTALMGWAFVLLMQAGFAAAILMLLGVPFADKVFAVLIGISDILVAFIRLVFSPAISSESGVSMVQRGVLFAAFLFSLHALLVCIDRWMRWHRVAAR
jgi:predicted membrane metal-binding protein